MSARKLWGEMEEEPIDEDLLNNVNFEPIIELGMQIIPEISVDAQAPPVVLPKPNLMTHTIQLHAYMRKLTAILEQNKRKRKPRVNPATLPIEPPEPTMVVEHIYTSPVAFLERKLSNFALGQGPTIRPFTPESHDRALKHSVAIAFGHIGIETCTETVLTATADALDKYISMFCKIMRTVVDNDANGLKSGFPDVISKVLSEVLLNSTDLQRFYEARVVKYHADTKQKCQTLRAKVDAIVAKQTRPNKAQMKMRAVPQLLFPAAMEGTSTSSLEPGFQMLQSLEEQQLQGMDLVDIVNTGEIKEETMQLAKPEPKPEPSTAWVLKRKN